MSDGVRKDDGGKVRFDLLPADALHEVARAFMSGLAAPGREPHNWNKGTIWSRYWNAPQRHLWAWLRGEQLDPQSGVSHLAHAVAGLLILLAYELRGIGEDDRPK
jgi:hypothetical protein